MIHIDEIETFFKENGFPNYDIEFMQGAIVKAENSRKFVESSLAVLRANAGKLRFYSYYLHLKLYYQKAHEQKQKAN